MKRRVLASGALLLALLCINCREQPRQGGVRHEVARGETLLDAAGRRVVLSGPARRVVSPFTMYTRLIAALGGCGQLVGISHACLLPEEEQGCGGGLVDLPDVGPFGANVELIASLRPDLIFASPVDVASLEAKTGAAVVVANYPDDLPMLEMFDRQIDLVGAALGLRRQADSLKRFIAATLAPVTALTAAIADSCRPRVYFAWTSWTGDILNTVCQFDPIELAGGRNVAREARNFAKGERGILVSREHLISWNPDVIFISRYQPQKWQQGGKTSTLPVTIADVIADPLLQSVNAIKNRRVYYTTGFCNWWPHQRALVQVLYMARLLHPARFGDLDVESRGNAVFKRFYGGDSLYSAMAAELELYRWE